MQKRYYAILNETVMTHKHRDHKLLDILEQSRLSQPKMGKEGIARISLCRIPTSSLGLNKNTKEFYKR